MKTGMVILNYNDGRLVAKLLDEVKDYDVIDLIVVVDNASLDDSISYLKKYESNKVVILSSKENKGYAYGNNIGLKYLYDAKCDFALVSNPDVSFSLSVLKEMILDMKKDEDIAFLGPKILENGRIIKGYKFPYFFSDLVSNMLFFGRFEKKLLGYCDKYYVRGINEVDVIHGCFFLARLKAFRKINFFDPHTFLYYEENILGKKALAHGFKVCVDTRLSVTHLLSVSVDKSLKRIRKYKELKKSEFYYEKEYCHLNFLGMFVLKLFYYISLGILYLTYWI